MKRNDNIEDIYPLSHLQQGMLFHTLYAPESEVYFEQLSCTLRGALDKDALRRAWQSVIDRHTILRTAFFWERREKPLQVVRRKLTLPWQQQDWRGLSTLEQQERFKAYLEADRSLGFDFSKAPLMRLVLIQLTEDTYHLVWSHHHILLDGWSVSLVMNEVFALYEAFSGGNEINLERTRPYRDYIAWLFKQDASKSESFWRQALKGFRAPTAFVIDSLLNRPENEKENYDERETSVSAEGTARLQLLATRHRLTLNTLVQGAWALLLSRYSGESDVLFGSVVSGRPASLEGVETMIGLFLNTLPVRVRISPTVAALAWLKQLQQQQLELREYEHTPLIDIQGWNEVSRGRPLFESILVFENYPVENSLRQENQNLEVAITHMFEKTNYPLTLFVTPEDRLLLQIAYDCSRFGAPAIERMLGHLRNLLEAIAANPDRKLSDLSVLTQSEQDQIFVEWNGTQTDYPANRCVHELFEDQVERQPDVAAVRFEKRGITYRELNASANQLARRLRDVGVGPEVIVGICLERSIEMVTAVLAVLKAGGGYLPLDPEYPARRLALMLQDSGAGVLLTEEALETRLPQHHAKIVLVDSYSQTVAAESRHNLINKSSAENIAYLIYTSGSTGRPKGVAMTHGPLSNLLAWQLERSMPSNGAKTLQFAPLSFDVAFQDIFSTLCAGGTLLLITEQERRDAEKLLAVIEKEKVERIFLPFVALQHIAEAVEDSAILPATLKEIITAGEQLQITPAITNLFNRLEGAYLENQYGPTESHVATAHRLTRPTEEWPALPPIGRPIANTQIYILGDRMQAIPVGVIGELYIGGVPLARGYLNRPDLTAEKFLPDPFSRKSGGRLYRTGDLARWLPDGNIEFFGRKDHQVKIRGFRIEPGEIEAVLTQHTAVREAVVAVNDARGGKRLVAYVVTSQEQDGLSAQLKSYLKERLPEYMLPAVFVAIDKMPLTPSGKINRLALPAPEKAGRGLEAEFVAPRSPVEEVLAEIWIEVLGVDRVGAHDNFFELGGHSLLATQIVSRIQETFQTRLPLRKVFEEPTVAAIAIALLDSGDRTRVERTAEMLLKIAQLSDEEAEQLLEEKLCKVEGGE